MLDRRPRSVEFWFSDAQALRPNLP